jgi:aspartate--ammonia ligase
VYVDQWDWERVINKEERNPDFLREIVRKIYEVVKGIEAAVCKRYPQIEPILPKEIAFIHSEELLDMYPGVGPRKREDKITEKYGAVFVIGIGGKLQDGTIHDNRAPDYDDWTTPTSGGRRGLNGDILLWYPLLKKTFEISSMGLS